MMGDSIEWPGDNPRYRLPLTNGHVYVIPLEGRIAVTCDKSEKEHDLKAGVTINGTLWLVTASMLPGDDGVWYPWHPDRPSDWKLSLSQRGSFGDAPAEIAATAAKSLAKAVTEWVRDHPEEVAHGAAVDRQQRAHGVAHEVESTRAHLKGLETRLANILGRGPLARDLKPPEGA